MNRSPGDINDNDDSDGDGNACDSYLGSGIETADVIPSRMGPTPPITLRERLDETHRFRREF